MYLVSDTCTHVPSNDLIGMPMLCKAWDIPIVRQTYDITKFEPKVMCKVTVPTQGKVLSLV